MHEWLALKLWIFCTGGLILATVLPAVADYDDTTALLFADATTDWLGGSGWAGAGLLGLVLGWLLMVHLPAKDKLLVQLMESKDKSIKDKDEQLSKLVDEFRAELSTNRDSIMKHCKEELTEVINGRLREWEERLRREVKNP